MIVIEVNKHLHCFQPLNMFFISDSLRKPREWWLKGPHPPFSTLTKLPCTPLKQNASPHPSQYLCCLNQVGVISQLESWVYYLWLQKHFPISHWLQCSLQLCYHAYYLEHLNCRLDSLINCKNKYIGHKMSIQPPVVEHHLNPLWYQCPNFSKPWIDCHDNPLIFSNFFHCRS